MKPKFRAWTEEGEVMYYDVYPFKDDTLLLSYDEIAFDEVPASDFILMQSTGLKDKSGKEIFEGDIVRFTLTDGFNYVTNEDGVVTYKLGAFYVVNGLAEYLISDINTNKIEVAGNIWEEEYPTAVSSKVRLLVVGISLEFKKRMEELLCCFLKVHQSVGY